MDQKEKEKERKISELASQLLGLAHDDILMHLRFFDLALAQITWQERKNTGMVAMDGVNCYYDGAFLVKTYKEAPWLVVRTYLHVVLHSIFFHPFAYKKLDTKLWDLATDIAVENTILDMQLKSVESPFDDELSKKLVVLKEDAGGLTAEKIYRHFQNEPPTENAVNEWRNLVKRDEHILWKPRETMEMTMEQWQKISERIKANLKSFTKAKSGAQTLEKNLNEATREHYDYSSILRRFMVMGEDMTVNDDEFDYIYYTYGLTHYGNLPLIEPLEYKETNLIKEFVIAIDTSASCRGEIVKNFLRKTYDILKSSENFFHKINVHIVQCDSQVQRDDKITSQEEFDAFMKYGKLTGFGATDFRPVFEYVDKLKDSGEFENLKGLIYFTDGYGIYPEKSPGYDVIFAFLDEDENRAPVPNWSIKVILEQDEMMDARDENKS